MAARFRIRTSQGQELSFATHEMFAEFVRGGDLSPTDVVYDAETREWSSALTHPVVLQIQYEAEEGGGGDGPPVDASDSVGSDGSSGDPDIGLDLAPAPEALSPEEEAAAFLREMEAERASELDLDEEPALEGFTMEKGSSGLVGGIVEAPEEPTPPPPPPPPPAPERREERRSEKPRKEEPRAERAPPAETPREAPPTRKKRKKQEKAKKAKAKKAKAPKRKKKAVAGRRYAPLLIVAAVVVAAGVYFGPELMAPATGEGSEAGPDTVAPPPAPPPLIPDTEEALRGRAQERYLATTRALISDLPAVPGQWLEGAYLASPSDYPQVRAAWNEILTTVRQIRAGDNERYRAGYLRALEEARVEGSARTLRLASAVGDFQGDVAPRAEHWDRVEALATAALRGHDSLVDAEGTIAYEPAATTPISGDPVIEAVGRNAEAQALLEQVLDMILAELGAPGGPGSAANLGEWIWEGLLEAVTG